MFQYTEVIIPQMEQVYPPKGLQVFKLDIICMFVWESVDKSRGFPR